MKFTLAWLKDHLETNASLKGITDKLTAIGLEVESVEDRAESLKAFTVAKILEATRHPEADKLQICKVQSDAGELQIVCGAANARAGLYVALAKEGTKIPANGMVIKKTKIRGVESCGMLCSLEELGLAESSEGIIELPEAPIGAIVADVLGLGDPVIDIAITPNRADCLGVRGIARDLAAAGLGRLKEIKSLIPQASPLKPISVSIETETCPQYIGCYISGVKNSESPDWLKKRLEAIGQKSISALVDITNYFTFDLGRPLHVYDASRINGNISVRGAKAGEKFAALNGKEYALPEGATVIADVAKILALGGVIGGAQSGCESETDKVFLEVALFEPAHIAQIGRALQIDSDARYRFERGVDVAFLEEAAKLAVAMIVELCGGQAGELVYAGKTPDWKREISFNPERPQTLAGVAVPAEKSIEILSSLGFTSKGQPATSNYLIQPPSWRADIEGEADMVEEIIRIYGYDKMPATPLPKFPHITPVALNLPQKRVHLAKRLLATRGMLELNTWSFLPEAWAEMFGGVNSELKLINPISADLSTMRPSILPNLLDAARRNAARGFKDVALFEVGLQFSGIAPDDQKMVAAGIRTGSITATAYNGDLFATESRTADAMDAKADALAVLETLGLGKAEISTANLSTYYHPSRSGAFVLGKNVLGYFGEIHPAIAAKFDIETSTAAFEIFLDAIPVARSKGTAKPQLKLSDYQAVERDFAFIVGLEVSSADIVKEINKAEKNLITATQIFDVYVGRGVEEGKKSVAVKVTLQSLEKTLSESDISTVSNAIISSVAKGCGGFLRQ